MRFLKIALIALAVVFVIAAGAGAYLLTQIDEEALARKAQAVVKDATGRKLELDEPIELRISFWPALVAENVRLSNASWGSRPDMVRARRVEAELDLIPLLRGTVRIARLVAVAPDVLLETDAKGRANWDFDAETPAGSVWGELPVAIETGALQMSDGVLVYKDGALGTQTRVEVKTLHIKDAHSRGVRAVAFTGIVNRRAFEVKGTLGDPGSLLAAGGTFPLDLVLTSSRARVEAKGVVTDALGRADARIDVQVEAAEAQELAAIVDRRIPPLGLLKIRATIERDEGRVGMRDLDLALGRPGALHVNARGAIADLLKPAGVALEFSASAPETEHAPAFTAGGRLVDSKAGVRVDGLKIRSGANELKGALEYRAGKQRPQLIASLQGASLNLGFLSPAMTTAGEPDASPESSRHLFPREPMPLGRLRAIDANAQISLGTLVLPNNMQLREVRTKIELRGGRLRVAPVTFVAGGGSATAALNLDASREPASLSAQLKGRRIVLGDLLAGTAIGEKLKGGPTDVDLEVTTQGSSPHAWAAGLNGSVRFEVGAARADAREISYGSDLLTQLADAINPFRKSDPDMQLQCAVLRMPIKNGVAVSDQGIGGETDKISVLSSGTIDLGKETLDMQLRPQVKEGIGLGGARLAQMVRLTGPLTALQLGVDFGGVAGTAASLAAGAATGGLSMLGEKLLAATEKKNACQIAAGAAESPSAETSGTTGGADTPDPQAPAGAPQEKPKERGFFDRIFGR